MADIEMVRIPTNQNPALEALASGISQGINQFYEGKEKEQELLGRSLPYLISAGLVQPTKDPNPDIEMGGIGFSYATPVPDANKQLEAIQKYQDISGQDPDLYRKFLTDAAAEWDLSGGSMLDVMRERTKNPSLSPDEARSLFMREEAYNKYQSTIGMFSPFANAASGLLPQGTQQQMQPQTFGSSPQPLASLAGSAPIQQSLTSSGQPVMPSRAIPGQGYDRQAAQMLP